MSSLMPRPHPRFGFYKYMKMDREEGQEDEKEEMQRRAFLFLNPDGECPPGPPACAHLGVAGLTMLPTDFLDDEDEGELLDSLEPTEASPLQSGRRFPSPVAPTTPPGAMPTPPAPPSTRDLPIPRRSRGLSWAARVARPLPLFLGRALRPRAAAERTPPKVYVTRVRPGLRAPPRALAPLSPRGPPWPPFPGVFLRPRPLPRVQLRAPPRPPRSRGRRTGGSQATELRPSARAQATQGSREGQPRTLGLTAPTADLNLSSEAQPVTSFLSLSQVSRPQLPGQDEEEEEEEADEDGAQGEEDSEEAAGAPRGRWREDAIDWQRTFSVGAMDFELLRSDWNDLRCNVSGNLQLPEAEAVDVVAQYMERLNARHGGYGGGAHMEGEGLASVGPSTFPRAQGTDLGVHPHPLGKSLLCLFRVFWGVLLSRFPVQCSKPHPPHTHTAPGLAPLSYTPRPHPVTLGLNPRMNLSQPALSSK